MIGSLSTANERNGILEGEEQGAFIKERGCVDQVPASLHHHHRGVL